MDLVFHMISHDFDASFAVIRSPYNTSNTCLAMKVQSVSDSFEEFLSPIMPIAKLLLHRFEICIPFLKCIQIGVMDLLGGAGFFMEILTGLVESLLAPVLQPILDPVKKAIMSILSPLFGPLASLGLDFASGAGLLGLSMPSATVIPQIPDFKKRMTEVTETTGGAINNCLLSDTIYVVDDDDADVASCDGQGSPVMLLAQCASHCTSCPACFRWSATPCVDLEL